jgi:hypothetical protein
MEIYLGSQHMTQQFEFYNKPQLRGEKGLRVVSYLTQRWSHDFTVSKRHHGEQFKCVVSVARASQQHQTEVVQIAVFCKYTT